MTRGEGRWRAGLFTKKRGGNREMARDARGALGKLARRKGGDGLVGPIWVLLGYKNAEVMTWLQMNRHVPKRSIQFKQTSVFSNLFESEKNIVFEELWVEMGTLCSCLSPNEQPQKSHTENNENLFWTLSFEIGWVHRQRLPAQDGFLRDAHASKPETWNKVEKWGD